MKQLLNRLPALATLVLVALLASTAAEARPRDIDTEALRQLLTGSPERVFLLDVRTPREYAMGRIPGSVLIPMNQITRRLREIPRDKQVVVVCATGARSGAVAQYLNQNGIASAVNYGGGVVDWARRGYTLER